MKGECQHVQYQFFLSLEFPEHIYIISNILDVLEFKHVLNCCIKETVMR